jgi:DNA-binding transcriptional ArsR family regulator
MTTGKRLLQRVAPFSRMIKGLAHPYRISIVYLLAHDPMWGEDIAEALHIKENLLMHHLNAMYAAGWVSKEQDGRHKLYKLREKTFRELPKLIMDTQFWRNLRAKDKS